MKIELRNVSRSFGDVQALADVSLEVREGETLGLVGPNGSGKTTLLKILVGLIPPTSGEIAVNGRVPAPAEWPRLRTRIGYMPERVSFYDNLSAAEVLSFYADLKGVSGERVGPMLDRVGLKAARDRRVGGYSKGMRQRLNLAQALLADPDLLVLDEPTSGLDPVAIREFYDFLSGIRRERAVSVVHSSHILAEIEGRIDRAAILKDGRLKAAGSLEELRSSLNIPLRLILSLRGTAGDLGAALAAEGAYDLVAGNGTIEASVSAGNKMRVMSVLMHRESEIRDLTIREPSLEEVFFGVD
ncbi:MAG: ABC transporter ATP-binding protein [Nitrospirae bacterium]|nr:ABC transporter ATP-binding protein [Nitrospirota bacterium]